MTRIATPSRLPIRVFYLIAALFFKTGERIRNMLSVMERDVGSIFMPMEDDLAGKYGTGGEEPFLRDGALRLGALSFPTRSISASSRNLPFRTS